MGSGVVRDSEKSEVAFLDDFRPRITMGNPIVTGISGFSDVGFSKLEKNSAKKSKNQKSLPIKLNYTPGLYNH